MKKLSLLAASLMFSAGVLAGAADNVSVFEQHVRLGPPSATVAAAFMVIRNNGAKDIKVVKAANPASRFTELHTHLNEGGVMKMRPVRSIDIKAREQAVLKSGGLHIMMIDLKAPMKEDDVVPITLSFDDGSTKQVEARVVRPMAGGMPPAMEHKH